MCLQSSVVAAPGVTPDLESSDDVLTCTWMFKGEDEEEDGGRRARPASSCVAFLIVSTEETANRLGIWEARGLHLSVRESVRVANSPVLLEPDLL